MLAMQRLSGSAAAFIAALASYRPMPSPPRRENDVERHRGSLKTRSESKAMARTARRARRR